MSYKQASRSDLQRVVGGMVKEGLAQTAQQIADIDKDRKRSWEAIAKGEMSLLQLSTKIDNTDKAGRLAFNEVDGRLLAASDNHRAVLKAISDLGDKLSRMQNTLGDMGSRLDKTDRALAAATKRMGEIESTLIRSREEAINKLAQTMSRAILSVLNETAGK